MRRISTDTRVPNKFGPGKDGFTNGDVVGGIAATDLEDVWFDSVQEEIANAIEADGQTLDPNDRTQLSKAIRGRLVRTSVYTIVSGQSQVSVDGGAFSTTGAGVFTKHPASSYVDVEMVGGGGGGAGVRATAAGQISVGAGGGGGAYGRGRYSAAAADGAIVTVGAGGAGGTSASGSPGGTTSLAALLSAPGGNGGQVLGPSTPPLYAVCTPNASAVGGYVNSNGNKGLTHFGIDLTSAFDGDGGGSHFGGGGARSGSGTGGTAVTPGGGGGGTANVPSQAARTGGSGAPGMVIIREYA